MGFESIEETVVGDEDAETKVEDVEFVVSVGDTGGLAMVRSLQTIRIGAG